MLESFDVLRVVPDCGCRYRCNPNQNVYLSIPFNISLISDFIPSILFFLKSRSERFKLRNPQTATGHAVAGAELCSGEHVAALTDHAGKVQHLKLFSKTFHHHHVKSTYWITCLHQQQFAKALDLERLVANSLSGPTSCKILSATTNRNTICKRRCSGRQIAQC